MNNDELATRRAQAIAEDRCFSKERLRDEFRMKPAPVLSRLSGIKHLWWQVRCIPNCRLCSDA